ncbi:DUF4871 domain-containing protein [Thalassobacillus pellis]|uniref:DUF4871 domain-containing protein n=1 Tax=Thalassobacillus pellis TaxID=748008 RepID=UPI001961F99E|nr:DUF4871 domain-containing protein [Thalassobacillus pellis]MBM7553967.1 hypothetical protein [Thalassobacillus pellis]
MKKYILLTVIVLAFGVYISFFSDKAKETAGEASIDQQAPMDEDSWEESALFQRDDKDKGTYKIRLGSNGKLAAMEFEPVKADTPLKYMWLFWGDKEDIKDSSLKIIGRHKESMQMETLFEQQLSHLAGIYGAVHHIPSNVTLPHEGVWRLEVYMDEELYGYIVIQTK